MAPATSAAQRLPSLLSVPKPCRLALGAPPRGGAVTPASTRVRLTGRVQHSYSAVLDVRLCPSSVAPTGCLSQSSWGGGPAPRGWGDEAPGRELEADAPRTAGFWRPAWSCGHHQAAGIWRQPSAAEQKATADTAGGWRAVVRRRWQPPPLVKEGKRAAASGMGKRRRNGHSLFTVRST